jgi:hypothetical protein
MSPTPRRVCSAGWSTETGNDTRTWTSFASLDLGEESLDDRAPSGVRGALLTPLPAAATHVSSQVAGSVPDNLELNSWFLSGARGHDLVGYIPDDASTGKNAVEVDVVVLHHLAYQAEKSR